MRTIISFHFVNITMLSQVFSLAFKLLHKQVQGPISSPISQHSHFNHQSYSALCKHNSLDSKLCLRSFIYLLFHLSHITFPVSLSSCSSQRSFSLKSSLNPLIIPSSIIYLIYFSNQGSKIRGGSCLQGTFQQKDRNEKVYTAFNVFSKSSIYQ